MTETIEQMLIRHEGLRLKPYRCSAGKLTIGVGRNLDDRGITKEEALLMLAHDINDCMEDLSNNIPWCSTLSENRQYVLIDMCFNLGIGGLMGFKNTLKLIREGKYKEAAKAMLQSKWASQVGNRAVELSKIMAGE
jgi:lysozyme